MGLKLRPYPTSNDPREIRDWRFRLWEMLTHEDAIPWDVVDKEGWAEGLQDVVGAMVSGNTEIGIDVTYQDSDGTLDFSLDFNGLAASAIAAGDVVAFYDSSGSDHNKITFSTFEATLSHDALADFTATEHFTMLDEDDFASDSDTQAATQQSIKAFGTATYAALGHLHDGDTIEPDGITSDGGAFSFTTTGVVTFNQAIVTSMATLSALRLYDADQSNFLDMQWNENVGDNSSLLWVVGAGEVRTITMTGNTTLDDWFDQSVKVAASPTFNALDLTGNLTMTKADPEVRLVDSGDSLYTRLTRTDTGGVARRRNWVFRPGGPGPCIRPDADGECMRIADDSAFMHGETAITISMWASLDTFVAFAGLAQSRGGGGFNGLRYWSADGQVLAYINNVKTPLVGTDLTAGNGFHHIVMTWESTAAAGDGKIRLYVDSVLKATSAVVGGTINNDDYYYAGWDDIAAGRVFKGKMDEIVFWSEALSANDVSDLFNAGAGLYTDPTDTWPTDGGSVGANMEGLWHLDEGAGSSCADSSGNGRTSTLLLMEEADWDTGIILEPGADVERNAWLLKDGVNAQEGGILEIGGDDTRLVLKGMTQRFEIGGTEVAQIDGSGDWDFGIDSDHTVTGISDLTTSGDITIATTKSLWLGSGQAAITFLDAATDTIIFSDCIVGVGPNASSSTALLSARDNTLEFTSTWYGLENFYIKTGGASDFADDVYGFHNFFRLNQAGGEVGIVRLHRNEFQQDLGDVGSVGNAKTVYGTQSELDLNAGNIWGSGYGLWITINQESSHTIKTDSYGLYVNCLMDGDVDANAYGGRINLDQVAGASTIGGTARVLELRGDLDANVTGTATMLYMNDLSGFDYNIYQNGTNLNSFGGSIDLRTSGSYLGLDAAKARIILTDAVIDKIMFADALVHFDSTAGLPYGGFYGNNIGWTSTAFGGGGTFVIVSDGAMATSEVRDTAFQNNQELLIGTDGDYLISWSISAETSGAGKHIEAGIGIGGVIHLAGRQHVQTFATTELALSGTATIALSATDTVSVMVTNVDGNGQVTVEHVNLTLVQVGG